MILSVHIAPVRPGALPAVLRARPSSPGLRWGTTAITAPLGGGFPPPRPTGVSLIAAWDGDEALDRFLSDDPLAARLAGGWHVRLEPLRATGEWSPLPDLPSVERPVDDAEPVAVLTLGRLKLTRTRPFLRASLPAERRAIRDPELLASTGIARPPRLVSTFTLWRTAAAMREYAYGNGEAEHLQALRAHRARPFHHESVFARFRPYASRGEWDGRDPLAPGIAHAARG